MASRPFTARIAGVRAAASQHVILFDADCRIADPTAVIDWYVGRLRDGARLAYTPVGFHDLPARRLARVRIGVHHLARWTKRVALRIGRAGQQLRKSNARPDPSSWGPSPTPPTRPNGPRGTPGPITRNQSSHQ